MTSKSKVRTIRRIEVVDEKLENLPFLVSGSVEITGPVSDCVLDTSNFQLTWDINSAEALEYFFHDYITNHLPWPAFMPISGEPVSSSVHYTEKQLMEIKAREDFVEELREILNNIADNE